jgi:S-adenosylmethionine hydrolase
VAPRPITFLSDYGNDDEFAGVCRAVIARIAPDARVIDLTHGIPRHAVRQGAAVLANALPYAPPGVHLAVVDPGVGGGRRGVAVRTADDDRVLVGPDNGLLVVAAERFGGVAEAVDLSHSPFSLEPVSATFQGRDVFAPVAARLALGADLDEAGDPIDSTSLVVMAPTVPQLSPERILAHVTSVDRFGNASLDLTHQHLSEMPLKLGETIGVEAGEEPVEAIVGMTFEDVEPGRMLLYEDSYGSLALAVNRGSAAELLELSPGAEVVLRPR